MHIYMFLAFPKTSIQIIGKNKKRWWERGHDDLFTFLEKSYF